MINWWSISRISSLLTCHYMCVHFCLYLVVGSAFFFHQPHIIEKRPVKIAAYRGVTRGGGREPCPQSLIKWPFLREKLALSGRYVSSNMPKMRWRSSPRWRSSRVTTLPRPHRPPLGKGKKR